MVEEDSPSNQPVNTCDKAVNAEGPALGIATFPGSELDLDSKTFDTTSEIKANDLSLNTAQSFSAPTSDHGTSSFAVKHNYVQPYLGRHIRVEDP